jgi:hypothetical protein
MSPVTHQTISLSRGKHTSPEKGACVMELASMLAGEPFSDHPRSVCPVVAALLRRYNDVLDDRRRQDLYEYAAKVVGSRGSARLEHARTEHLRQWISERPPRRWQRWLPSAYVLREAEPSLDMLAERVVHNISRHERRSHVVMLGLVDELLALDPGARVAPPPTRALDLEPSREPSCLDPTAR